jgi:extradiol dioxygenase family protein
VSQPDLLAPFHLAIPVDDLITAAACYEGVLGCCRGRESAKWIDLNFFGHQVVLHHAASNPGREVFVNAVDSELIPVPHFGVVLDKVAFEALEDRVRSSKTNFRIAPTTRFKGRVGEQRVFFLQDPCGNCLEFKSFSDPKMLFQRDHLSYE